MKLIVTYTDGREDIAAPSARAQCMAEEHAAVNHWGDPTVEARMRYTYYLAYTALRIAQKVSVPYDSWLDSVSTVRADAEETVNPT